MATKMVTVYVCPEHTEKEFSSWRKFRGHWTNQHPGQEAPARETVRQEKEIETEEPKKSPIIGGPPPGGYVRIGENGLPEDPVDRLGTILDVHGIEDQVRDSILRIFQLHPGYQQNPYNLYSLLSSKLTSRFKASIPLIVQEFSSTGEDTPAGISLIGNMGMGQNSQMLPFMMGMNNQPVYNPWLYANPAASSYSHRPSGRTSSPAGEGEEEGVTTRERRASSGVEEMTAMFTNMAAFMDAMKKINGGGEENSSFLEAFQASQERMNEAMEKVAGAIADSKEETRRLLQEQKDQHAEEMKNIREDLHQKEVEHLNEKVADLQNQKMEEQTQGLGGLLSEAGSGLAAQVTDIRKGVESVTTKLATAAENISKIAPPNVPGLPSNPLPGDSTPSLPNGRTLQQASALLDAEQAVAALSQELTQKR